ncbi:unnamed protein product, partial [Prorocentrum cordatum]
AGVPVGPRLRVRPARAALGGAGRPWRGGRSGKGARVVLAGPRPPELSVQAWCQHLVAPGTTVHRGMMDPSDAQATKAVLVEGFLGPADLEAIESLAHRAEGLGREVREVRSAPLSDSWEVLFLQAGGLFEAEAPGLARRLASLARAACRAHGWVEDADDMRLRVVEYHRQRAPGPGLPDSHHYDLDSLVTVDVMLSAPGADFRGGALSTLEPGGRPLVHELRQGDALVFAAHKFHSVGPVLAGCRRVLVAEFWRGALRRCPHRCQ